MRAYSTFEIKRADIEAREIEGIASTPSTDLAGDIVEPHGMRFGKSVPFLWQHDHGKPLGTVIDVRATNEGVYFKAKLARVTEAGTLRDRLDEAWQSIKSGLVRGISIGFSGDDWEPIASGGRRFKSWLLHEISAVTIPCNTDCSISTVKHFAQSQTKGRVVRIGKPASRVVRLDEKAVGSSHPVANAMMKASEDVQADLARLKELRELGGTNAMLIRSITAGARATDSELEEIKRRLKALEG